MIVSEEIKKDAMDTQLTPEELENVAGGYEEHKPNYFSPVRFTFEPHEVNIIKNKFNITLEAFREYRAKELIELGFPGSCPGDVRVMLDAIGLTKVNVTNR